MKPKLTLHSDTAIYGTLLDLGRLLLPAIRQVNKDVKLLFGQDLKAEVVWMGVLILRAQKARGAAKCPVFDEILEHIEIVKISLRLCHDLGYMPVKTWSAFGPPLESLGRQASSLRNKFAPPQ